jgi:hypothetical protein
MSDAILRASVALGVCAALFNLLWWHQPIMEMANGHTSAFKVLYAMWFVLVWGVASGALTGVAISSVRRRSPGLLSASFAFVLSLVLSSTVCLVLHRGLTDANFMHDAMSGMHPHDTPGMDMDMHSGMQMGMHQEMRMDVLLAHTPSSPFNLFGALAPNVLATALSVVYAFGGKRRWMRLQSNVVVSESRKPHRARRAVAITSLVRQPIPYHGRRSRHVRSIDEGE